MKRNKLKQRRGLIAVVVAICLIAVVGVAALSLDAGLLLDKRRTLQAGTDAAALAAAVELFQNYGTNNGLDPNGKAKASALSTAAANGFSNDGTISVVTVNIPPTSGFASGKAGYAEVINTLNQPRCFSAIFGSGNVPVTARAVARGNPGTVGMLLLNPSDSEALDIIGKLTVLNSGTIQVNSTNSGAVQIDNTGVLVSGGINDVGGMNNSGNVTYTGGGSLQMGATTVADPLASIPEPTPSGTNYGNMNYNGGTATMQPGMYDDVTIQKSATVTMAPGNYYISSKGSITVDTATLNGSGVMIYNQSGDHLKFQKATAVNLSPPTSGTYQGISIWQPRSDNSQIHIESSNSLTISGTFYAQTGFFDIRPDQADTVFNLGPYIADHIEAAEGYGTGKSDGQIYVNPGSGVATQRPVLVE